MNRLLGLGVLMSAVFVASGTTAQSNEVGEQGAQVDAGQESKGKDSDRSKIEVKHIAQAERYMRGVFGGDFSVVTELAADDIVMSWPIFERLFNTQALRGRDAVKKFVTSFSKKWNDIHLTFHRTVAENDEVILIWDFQANNIASKKTFSWGGISFYRFNEDGKIVEEIGEESTPGPVQRLLVEKPDK